MITIACTNCKTQLTMDEAFAGGVCRCQHCGTIQTVPSHLKKGSPAGTAAGQAVGVSKSLYQQTRTPTDAASGLEALGDVVTSSGLGSGRLKAPPRVSPRNPSAGASIDNTAAQPARNPLFVPLLIAVAVLLVVLIGLVLFLVTRSGTPGGANNTGTPGAVVVPAGPSFLGQPLKGISVVYLIDRGNSMSADPTSDYFDGLKAAILKSLRSLGPSRSFKVVLWDNGDTPVSIPATGIPINASDQNIQQVSDALRDVVASGASTMNSQLDQAVGLKPDAIVIVTAKVDLDDADAAALKKAAKAGIPLYLFDIGNNMLADPFLSAADASGGAYHSISYDQLTQLAQ
ncbi:MAG TPA: hypothetical protein VHY37_05805 [Tepidisphaeraceae bacterium]|jgi:hypothetical protein|nr:hypothetical protein [Tepidisphaeraceae bacterium]